MTKETWSEIAPKPEEPALKKKRFSLLELTTRHMTRAKPLVLPGNKHYYPSESSVSWIDRHDVERVSGACLRQPYLRITGEAKPSKISIHSAWIFALGKAVEIILVEQWKQAGIWVANNVKFYNEEYNISGEIDCVLRDPETDELFIIEVKSFYGYNASKQIMGTKHEPGRPKDSHILQTLIYLNEVRDMGIDHARLFYAARDSSDRKEFILELYTDEKGIVWPMINGTVDYRFPLKAIYDRFQILDKHVTERDLPPSDFELIWSKQKVEARNKIGDISQSKYNKWKRKPWTYPIGDWMCSYCQFCNYCWNKDGTSKID